MYIPLDLRCTPSVQKTMHIDAINRLKGEDSRPHKVMLRFDRDFLRRGLRSYRGYEIRGRIYARLNFDHYAIDIDPFGRITRVTTR